MDHILMIQFDYVLGFRSLSRLFIQCRVVGETNFNISLISYPNDKCTKVFDVLFCLLFLLFTFIKYVIIRQRLRTNNFGALFFPGSNIYNKQHTQKKDKKKKEEVRILTLSTNPILSGSGGKEINCRYVINRNIVRDE
jgi:hypothetical protein